MSRFEAGEADGGHRLDVVLAGRAGISRAAAQRLIEAGEVALDGRPAVKRHLLRAGEVVTYRVPAACSDALEPEDVPHAVVYEDDWLLVVDKAAGVVVHPAHGHRHGTLVHGLLQKGIGGGHELRPGVVHRLDKDTSGLLILSRDETTHRRLVAAMARREIERRYVALLCGALPEDEATIDAPIGRHVRDRKRMSVHTARPRRAVTHFVVRERLPGYTLVDVRLETGRTHQIRVHFAALGHPVAGDLDYGRRRRPPGLPRQFLHAARLAFAHPVDGRRLSFTSPLPEDLQYFLDNVSTSSDGPSEDLISRG